MKPSVLADALARAVLLVVSAAGLATVVAQIGQGWMPSVVALGIFFAIAWAVLSAPVARPRYSAVSIDAGGNWAFADRNGWHRVAPSRIVISGLGWITLYGASRPVVAAPGLASHTSCTITIWSDSVPRDVWRRINVAARWLIQRRQSLLVPAIAADPRLRGLP